MDELEEALRTTEILEPMLAEVDQVSARRECLLREGAGRLRQKDLSPVPGGHDPRRPVDRRAEEVVAAMLSLTGVHAHPHPQRTGLTPRFRGDAELGSQGGGRGVDCPPEHRHHPIARRLDDLSG